MYMKSIVLFMFVAGNQVIYQESKWEEKRETNYSSRCTLMTAVKQIINNNINQSEVEFAECDCCGLTEECTLAYIASVRAKFEGQWLCGLCSEAVNDETIKSDENITTNDAMDRHMRFCKEFKSSNPPPNPAEELISAMRQLLRRTLDSPRKNKSKTTSFSRSNSCFSSLSNE